MKILLIQLRQIGDVLMTTPAIRALKQNNPDSYLSFVTESPSDQVLRLNPYLDELLLFDKRWGVGEGWGFIQKLRRGQYDAAIDFHGNPRSAFLCWMSGAKTRIGFNHRGRHLAYHHKVRPSDRPSYSAADKLRLIEPLGVSGGTLALDFPISDQERDYAQKLLEGMGVMPDDLLISISPVSRQPYKVWPSGYFAQVADWLVEDFRAKILFLWGPGEQHFVEAVRSKMRNPALPDYEVPTLGQTSALLEKAWLHVGNDNGPRHFAIAVNTPTVAVFGRPRVVSWTPPDSGKHLALEHDPGCKSQCRFPDCGLECLHGVSVAAVKSEILRQLKIFSGNESDAGNKDSAGASA